MFTGAAVVMGVASSGKTLLGEALARELNAVFIEGDTLHPPANIAKMSAGTPLTDADRLPWLADVGTRLQGAGPAIAACSALKRAYRDCIVRHAGRPVLFVHLHGSTELLAERIASRKGHFMPASLLDSQLAALEMPTADERHVTVDIALPLAVQLRLATAFLLSS